MKTDFIKDLNRLTWEKKQKTFDSFRRPHVYKHYDMAK